MMQHQKTDKRDEKAAIKNCELFINNNNNTHVDNAKDLDVVISMYNLAQYSDNY